MFYIEIEIRGQKWLSQVLAMHPHKNGTRFFLVDDNTRDWTVHHVCNDVSFTYDETKAILLHHQKNNVIADFTKQNHPKLREWLDSRKDAPRRSTLSPRF